MDNLSEKYQDLLINKAANALTDEEKAELDIILHDNVEIREAYEKLLGSFPDEIKDNNFKKLDQPGYWRDLTGEILSRENSTKKVVMLRRIFMAAAVCGIVLMGWYLLRKDAVKESIISHHVPKQSSVELKLASGEVINLSSEKGNLTKGATTMINENNSLEYSVRDNEGTGVNTISVPFGKDYRINLSDGSVVWMNSLTRLDFPFKFSDKTREITLTGEAFLEIAKDAKRPFIIHLPNSIVRVLGTTFNINTYDTGMTKVALVEGKVTISGGNHTVHLVPGKQAIYDQTKDLFSQEIFDTKKVLSWRKGLFYFDDANLREMGPVLQRWFNVRVQIDNQALLRKRFAGVLDRNQPLEVFLNDLKGMSRISSFIDKDGVLHFK